MITFEFLVRTVKQERESPGLTKLPDSFYGQAEELLKSKQAAGKGGWELDSVRVMIEDLNIQRERKVVNAALFFLGDGIISGNMTASERSLFRGIVNVVKDWRADRKESDSEPKSMIDEAMERPSGVNKAAPMPLTEKSYNELNDDERAEIGRRWKDWVKSGDERTYDEINKLFPLDYFEYMRKQGVIFECRPWRWKPV